MRIEGWVEVCGEGGELNQLQQWWSVERSDHFLVGSAKHRADAEGAKYALLQWNEGCLSDAWVEWPNTPPSDCPFPQASVHLEMDWGNYAAYGGADTWFPAWTTSNTLLTPFTDGTVNGVKSHSYDGVNAVTGHAVVTGDDPHNLTIANVGVYPGSALPYEGRYPSVSFVKDDTWYYGTYTLENYGSGKGDDCGNWCIQGPLVSIRVSTDMGKTWKEPTPNMTSWFDSVFKEGAVNGSKVKFGAPHAVDFGKNMQHSPDGKVYLVGHGVEDDAEPQSWMQGSTVSLARAEVSPSTINQLSSWEFSASPTTWTSSGQLSSSKPLFTWTNRTGVVTSTYIPALDKYIMVVSTPTYSPSTVREFDTYLLLSSSLQGPFQLITYLASFGPEAYFVNIPSKFLSPNITTRSTDGAQVLEFWLSFSANFAFHNGSSPPGAGYHWTLQHCRFVLANET